MRICMVSRTAKSGSVTGTRRAIEWPAGCLASGFATVSGPASVRIVRLRRSACRRPWAQHLKARSAPRGEAAQLVQALIELQDNPVGVLEQASQHVLARRFPIGNRIRLVRSDQNLHAGGLEPFDSTFEVGDPE